jgi:hypothetical protein
MSKTISISGSMYECNYIELTDTDLQRLIEVKKSNRELWDDLEDIHDELMGESLINGFSFKSGDPKPQVFVGSDEVKVDCESTDSEESGITISPNDNYLVFEQWSKNGSMELEIDDEFDPDEFSMSIDSVKLPNGQTRKVLEPFYQEGDFEFQDSQPAYQDIYILKADGARIDL